MIVVWITTDQKNQKEKQWLNEKNRIYILNAHTHSLTTQRKKRMCIHSRNGENYTAIYGIKIGEVQNSHSVICNRKWKSDL